MPTETDNRPRQMLALTWAEDYVLTSRGLRAWAASLRKHTSPATTRIVILSPAPVQIDGAENIVIQNPPGTCAEHRRWAAFADVIAKSPEATHILLADGRDIIFQADPFALVAEGDSRSSLVVVSEYQKTKDHPWCVTKAKELSRLLNNGSGNGSGNVVKPDLNRIEINGGLQLGDRASILLFVSSMELFLHGRHEKNLDQALLNWWLYNRCPVPWQFTPPGWYIHGESVKTGKQKIKIIDGVAFAIAAEALPAAPATAFHQYDRTWLSGCILRNLNGNIPVPAMRDTARFLVIAHYNENLDWLDRFDLPHLIITKGNTTARQKLINHNGLDPAAIVQRPNIGFEAETWAWFFHTYYDNLPEQIICLQGAPFPHITPALLSLAISPAASRPPDEPVRSLGEGGSPTDEPVRSLGVGGFSHSPLHTPGHHGYTSIIGPPDHKGGLPMRQWWTRLFKSPPPLNWHTPYGGQFIVHRDTITSRPRAFWKLIADNCRTKADACTLERLWQFILSALP